MFSTGSLTYGTFRLLFPENPTVGQIARRATQKVVHDPILGMGGLNAEQFQLPIRWAANSFGIRKIVGQMFL